METGAHQRRDTMKGSKFNAVEDINHAGGTHSTGLSASASGLQNHRERRPNSSRSVASSRQKKCRGNILTSMSFCLIHSLEKGFFRMGHFIGTYPVLTLVVVLLLSFMTGLGMKTFEGSNDDEDIWVPKSSRLNEEKDWIEDTFPANTRYVTYVIKDASNVLTSDVVKGMLDYYLHSFAIKVNGKKLSQLCFRTGSRCSVTSILELWDYNAAVIRNLTNNDIITTINNTKTTPLSGVDVETLLGGKLTRDSSGAIISAEATQIRWVTSKEHEGSVKDFEKKMIDFALDGHSDIETTYVYASRSLDDEGYGAVNKDISRLLAGFIIVFLYTLLALGRFNLLEQKAYLSMSGIFCVVLSILISTGIGTALGVLYSPIQTLLPFLLLGIGVDDMFVIVEAWKNLSPEEQEFEVPEKISACLGKAGMSITVTSVTDVVAFGIGATTDIPALGSFCIYATIGILALFLLVITLFVAVLALDERRRRGRRDGCIVCYRHSENYQPNSCSTGKSFLQRVFENVVGPFLTNKIVKAFIIIISVVMASLGVWRFSLMEQDFDVVNYIPSDSYAHEFSRSKERLFNRQGMSTRIYCGAFDYYQYRTNLKSVYDRMANSTFIQTGSINSWFTAYDAYLNSSGITISTEAEYYTELSGYISGDGDIYSSSIKWNSTTEPRHIEASYISAAHVRENDAKGDIDSMDNLRKIVDSSGFPQYSGGDLPKYKCFAYDPEYMYLETNKILGEELIRNLILAGASVLVISLILVANLRTSLYVFICVFFTVGDVGGVLELWGTTIDTASSVLLTLAVGLAVDYSVHIGHTFMNVEGTKDERARKTLADIGPAVFNGGLSTILAFILLADSVSYSFRLFFRVFMSVVLFGMFHGLCLLPVLLSLIGPPSYKESQGISDENEPPNDGQIYNQQKNEASHSQKQLDRNGEISNEGYEGPFYKLQNGNGEQTKSPERHETYKQDGEKDDENSSEIYTSSERPSSHTSRQTTNL